MGTIYLFKRTELAVRSCVEVALLGFDLTPSQLLLLLLLDDEGPLSAAQTARAVGVRPQSITEIIAPLRAKKLIRRQASTRHRRILEISLSAAGKRLLSKATKAAAQLEHELLADLSAEELQIFRRALDKLMVRAEQHECHPNVRRLAAQGFVRAHASRPWNAQASQLLRRRATANRAQRSLP
jgi:DNA-binding MarR family transcriptional regulator